MAEKLQPSTVVRGAFWAALTLYLGKVVGFLATLILAALLQPADFGLYALVYLVYNAMLLLADLGLRHALIYFRGNRRRLVDTVFTFLMGADLALYAAIYLAAPTFADFFGEPRLAALLRVIAVGVIFSAYSSTCAALLEKELDFRRKLLPDLLPRVAQLFVAVGLAVAGAGVWSFIFGHLAQAVLEAAGYALVSPQRPRFGWAPDEARRVLRYGAPVILSSILLFVFTNFDDAVVGKLLGSVALGYYYFAYRLSNFPATNISWLAGRIAFPSFSKLRDDLDRLRRAFLVTTRLVALLIFPASAVILVFAGPALRLVYGEKWLPAVPVVAVLVAFGLLRALFGYYGSVFFALGRPERILPLYGGWLLLGFAPIVFVAESWGLIGVSWLLTAALLVGGLLRLPGLLEALRLRLSEYLGVMVLPALFSAAAGAAARLVLVIGEGEPGWTRLVLAAVFFSALYMLAAHRHAPQLWRVISSAGEPD